MADSTLTIALVYPTLLGTYGDGGNARVLAERLRWRGIGCELVEVELGMPIPRQADVVVLGGGEDTAQTLAVRELTADGAIGRAVDAGRPVFAVCAGLQVLGANFFDAAGRSSPGLGLLDVTTERLPGPRAVGELLAEPLLGGPDLPPLTGYENHGGATVLGPAAHPLARVVHGVGNGDGTEGAVQGSIIATYLHGPALARNPALADHVLTLAAGELAPLDDAEEHELRRERISAVRRSRRAPWHRQWRPPARNGCLTTAESAASRTDRPEHWARRERQKRSDPTAALDPSTTSRSRSRCAWSRGRWSPSAAACQGGRGARPGREAADQPPVGSDSTNEWAFGKSDTPAAR
jgi:CobQ-like glutamine amidotransferase family enzyme